MLDQVKERPESHIWIPLDTSDTKEALRLVTTLKGEVGLFKIGTQLTTSVLAQTGSKDIPADEALAIHQDWRELIDILDGEFFWDGKWMDVGEPTLMETAKAVQLLHPRAVDFHVPTGKKGAIKVMENRGNSDVLGVTVLTSIETEECVSLFGDDSIPKVLQFAQLLVEYGAHGVICSPLELAPLRQAKLLEKLKANTPGIRPAGKDAVGQARFATPYDAIRDGATNLIVGSPVTKDPNPVDAARRIAEEINRAWMDKFFV